MEAKECDYILPSCQHKYGYVKYALKASAHGKRKVFDDRKVKKIPIRVNNMLGLSWPQNWVCKVKGYYVQETIIIIAIASPPG